MLILNYKNKELTRIETAKQIYWLHYQIKVKLTKMEAKLLLLLSSNITVTFEDIGKFLYGNYIKEDHMRIHAFVYRIRSKYNLNIKNIKKQGYRLEDELFINY